jgi:hypothetical protein
MVHGRHGNFLAELNTTLQKLALLLDASSMNMGSAARRYERTDEKSAAEIDAAYPASPRPIADVS